MRGVWLIFKNITIENKVIIVVKCMTIKQCSCILTRISYEMIAVL